MKTLQQAHQVLSDYNLSPVYFSKVRVGKDGKLLQSPIALSVYVPMAYLSKYMTLFSRVIPGFQLNYDSVSQQMLIFPTDKKFQFIANMIYSSMTEEQLYSVGNMINTHYPEDPTLISELTKKFSNFVN